MAKPARPNECKPDVCDLARKFCMLGAMDDDLADLFEVDPATIADWIANFPDFAAALKQGREIADATAAERLFQRAIGFSHEVEKVVQSGGKPVTVKYTERYPPDTTALVFWLKNRQGGRWRDRPSPSLPLIRTRPWRNSRPRANAPAISRANGGLPRLATPRRLD